jgi:hypothetical protein
MIVYRRSLTPSKTMEVLDQKISRFRVLREGYLTAWRLASKTISSSDEVL